MVSENPWTTISILKMYWRYHQNKEFAFGMTADEVATDLDPEKMAGPIEDYFCVKTDVKHRKRTPESIEAEKVRKVVTRNFWRS